MQDFFLIFNSEQQIFLEGVHFIRPKMIGNAWFLNTL